MLSPSEVFSPLLFPHEANEKTAIMQIHITAINFFVFMNFLPLADTFSSGSEFS
jgi:hypothetical protein